MATTYSNAFLVVGASCAPDSTSGFIASTGHKERQLQIATIENGDGSVSEIYTQECQPHGNLCHPFTPPSERGPLASRAWTLQGQILSTRMIRFERNELFWECRASTQCECMELNQTKSFKKDMEREAAEHKFDIWHDVVTQYRMRLLTYGSDLLPALSGVVTRLQEFGAGEYLAGLWKLNLPGDLLWGHWYNGRSKAHCVRSESYRAPTWSWASLQQPEKTGRSSFSFLNHSKFSGLDNSTHVLHAHCSPSGHDPNGAVQAGSIVLQGKLIGFHPFEESTDDLTCLAMEIRRDWLSPEDVLWLHPETYFDSSKPQFEVARLGGLLIATFANGSETREFLGLILREVANRANVFERIGVWKFKRMSHYDCSESCEREVSEWYACEHATRKLFERLPDTQVTII